MIPLLYECALESAFTAVWCVGASRRVQMRRLRARGFSEGEAVRSRLNSQLPVADKMAKAHVVFWGEGTPASAAGADRTGSFRHEEIAVIKGTVNFTGEAHASRADWRGCPLTNRICH